MLKEALVAENEAGHSMGQGRGIPPYCIGAQMLQQERAGSRTPSKCPPLPLAVQRYSLPYGKLLTKQATNLSQAAPRMKDGGATRTVPVAMFEGAVV